MSRDTINSIIRNKSLNSLSAITKNNKTEIEETNSPQAVCSHWMSLITIAGNEIKVTFKTQFTTSTAKHFASLGRENKLISNTNSRDFIREYCNIMAGRLKQTFAKNQITTSISLPILCRGFDDLFFTASDRSGTPTDRWKLRNNDFVLHCSSFFEISSELKVIIKDNDANDYDNDIEFF